MAAPMTDGMISRIIACTAVLFYFYRSLSAEADFFDDFLLCRQCGHEIAKAEHLRKRASPNAVRQRNDTILGIKDVLIQLFENPQGRKFEVITTSLADVYKGDQAYHEYSWFPGFLWRMSVCPRCGFHLGWSFEPIGHTEGKKDTDKTFIGLILENLLHQDYADNLLITPKSYHS